MKRITAKRGKWARNLERRRKSDTETRPRFSDQVAPLNIKIKVFKRLGLKNKDYHLNDFTSMMRAYNSFCKRRLLEGYVVDLNRLGTIGIYGVKTKKQFVNRFESKKANKTILHDNSHSGFIRYRVEWHRGLNMTFRRFQTFKINNSYDIYTKIAHEGMSYQMSNRTNKK